MSTAFQIVLTGGQEVPPNGTAAQGLGTVVFDSAANTATYEIRVWGLDWGAILGTPPQTPGNANDNVTILHVHNGAFGANGPVALGLIGPAQDVDDLGFVINADGSVTFSGVWETTDASNQPITNFTAAMNAVALGAMIPLYFNVHTSGFPGGEIRGQWECSATDNGEVVVGTPQDDLLFALGGNDEVQGFDGLDRMNGGFGSDSLSGGRGSDVINGDEGKDVIRGDMGADTLAGGLGKDKFVYTRLADSPTGGNIDLITDFDPTTGDVVDVKRIDADVGTAGNQAFVLVAAFSGAGAEAVLTYFAGPDRTRLELDNDADGFADFSLLMDGNHTGTAGFIL